MRNIPDTIIDHNALFVIKPTNHTGFCTNKYSMDPKILLSIGRERSSISLAGY